MEKEGHACHRDMWHKHPNIYAMGSDLQMWSLSRARRQNPLGSTITSQIGRAVSKEHVGEMGVLEAQKKLSIVPSGARDKANKNASRKFPYLQSIRTSPAMAVGST